MRMLVCKIICVCAFALIAADASVIRNSDDEEINFRLPSHTKPLHYDLRLNPHLTPDNFTFDGEVFIDINILNQTKILTLHTKKLIIAENATFLRSKDGSDSYAPTTYNHDNLTEFLSLGFDKDLPIGHYTLYLKFTGVLSDGKYGFYKDSYTESNSESSSAEETVWFAGTNFKGTYARAAFPCWDEPALKATFKIAIKHDQNYTAISNTPISEVSEVDESDGKIWTHFEESPVMSTYLVNFLVSDFRIASNPNGINFWSRDIETRFLGRMYAEKTAIELGRYTNNSVQMAKVDHVALPGLLDRSTESWGLITYREDAIKFDPNIPINEATRKIVYNIIHQMSYQLLDNAVTPSWWTNTWMNGGLAKYLENYVLDMANNDLRLSNLTAVKMLNSILFADTFNPRPLNFEPKTPEEINFKFSLKKDDKAFLLLRMLSHCLSDDVFHAGLIKYLNKHKYGVVEPEDLWGALQEALDESTVPKFNIQEVMNTWIGQERYPIVTVTRDYETGQIKIRQESFQWYKNINDTDAASKKWWIPINFASRTNPDFSSTLPTHWLSPEDEELVIDGVDPQDWVIVNIQQTGFYRVNYDRVGWLKIADYLYSENYQKIPVLNRAQIINDAIFLMFSNKMDPRYFMDLTKYLQNETDISVWYPILKILNYAKGLSFVCNGGGAMVKSYVVDLMNNLIEAIGISDKADDDYFVRISRNVILEEACAFDHPICLREARAQLMAYLENKPLCTNRSAFETLSDQKMWMFCNGVKQANETIWKKLLEQDKNNDLLLTSCFGYSKNMFVSEKFLKTMLKNDLIIQKEEVHRFMYSVLSTDFPLYVDVLLNFTVNYWDQLATIFDDPVRLLYDIRWNVASREQIQEIKAFLNNVGIDFPSYISLSREEDIESAETIMNKIRYWLKLRISSGYTKSELIDLLNRQCNQPL